MIIDAHVHIWDLHQGAVEYPWLTPALGTIYRTFTLADARADMDAAGVSAIVLVQASDSLAETDALLAAAAAADRPARVVGWLPLTEPVATAAALERYAACGTALVGARHLIHDEPDRGWLLRSDVAESMNLLARAGLVFDAVAETSDLLALVPRIAERHPSMTIVLDHLGKPPIATGGWQPWARMLAAAAAQPNVVAKISGLNTASGPAWTPDSWRPYVDLALDHFGADRLMLGGDWPVALQAGSYQRVFSALLSVLDDLTQSEREQVMRGTASRVYQFAG